MIVNCDFCNNEFEKEKRYIKANRKNYCCKKCQSNGQMKQQLYNCATCKNEIFRLPSEVKRSKTGNVFCNQSCAASFNNKITKTKEVLIQYQKNTFKKYVSECVNCGFSIKEALQAHHIDKDRGNNNIDNLIILCANCHARVHYGDLVIDEKIKSKRKLL